MDEQTSFILSARDRRGVVTLTLNRPEMHNAFDDRIIRDLNSLLMTLGGDPSVRVIVLAAAGKSFSAGADLGWMKRMATYSHRDNLDDATALATLLDQIATCPRPVVARVHGAAFGGGVGLVAACDLAIGSVRASFCLSEVRLGLIPAVISPYVIEAIGVRAARRFVLTAERFTAEEAGRLGLLHDVVAEDELDAAVERQVDALLRAGPCAISAAKRLVADVAHRPMTADLKAETAARIADLRVSEEGQEGLQAFLEKRAPAWIREG